MAYITIINVYASTKDAKEEENGKFHDKLRNVCERRAKNNDTLIMGYTNTEMEKQDYISKINIT